MAIIRLDHVGIATTGLDESTDIWERLGLPGVHTEDVVEARTRVSFHPVGDTNVELLEGLDEDSPVARFVAKRGPGVHHLCFEVDDIEAEMQRIRTAGFRFLSAEPQSGAHGSRVAFIHPKDTGGVLIELNQKAAQ